MKIVVGVVAAIIVAVALWLVLRGGATPAIAPSATNSSTNSPSSTSSTNPSAPVGSGATTSKPTTARRVSPEERAAFERRILAARNERVARAAANGHAPAAEATDIITLEQVGTSVRAALDATIPLLGECYPKDYPDKRPIVVMTLFSDPDIGTVIDTDQMHDDAGKPLPPAIDDCLRTTMETLELPPLEAGGHLPLQYSFAFDQK